VLLLGLSWLLTSSYYTVRMLLVSGTPAWLAAPDGDVARVTVVRPGSPGEGVLRVGDEVVALDGKGTGRDFEARGAFAFDPPRPYRLLVRRDGALLELRLHTVPFGLSYASFFVVGFLAVQWLFYLAGVAVFLLRPCDRLPQLLAAVFVLFALGSSNQVPVETLSVPAFALFGIGQVLASAFWPVFLHLFLVFPEPSPIQRLAPSLPRWGYVVGFAFLLNALGLIALAVHDMNAATAFFLDHSPFSMLLAVLVGLYSLTGIASLLLSYRSARGKARSRLGVVVAGCLMGFLPLFVFMLVTVFSDIRSLNLWTGRLLVLWAILSLPLVPASFAYAIIKHRVNPVGIILRHSLRYLLVVRGFVLFQVLELAVVLGFLLLGPPARWLATLPLPAAVLFTMAVTAAALGAHVLLHQRVMPRIDRRFLRGSYDTQRVLAEVGQAARQAGSVEEVLRIGLDRVKEALHPESAAAFLKDEQSGHYLLATGEEAGTAALRADSTVVQRLRRSPAPLDAEGDGILLPIVAKGDLLGILSLGPRLGDLPYSGEDRDLLNAVAWQVAFAVENTRLLRRMVEEQRLRHEINLARDVQRRLFPAGPPENGRLELAGLCHPAQGIGGDYYDFLPMPDGRVGIAVADVAGKGISAALLMSIVQASLRSQYRSGVSLPDLVASMNELLYRSTARNSFATFFLAQFDERSARLTYVNAGHNPPLLLRAGAGAGDRLVHAHRSATAEGGVSLAVEPQAAHDEVRLLHTGGLVIGAFAGVCYEAESVDLVPGDLLVAYTDGVTEAFDPHEREFGEQRLLDVVLASRDLPVAMVADRIVAAVRDFVREAPQFDDITLVVARLR